jgi:fructose-specific component phosphotransferase system IIB-like protein
MDSTEIDGEQIKAAQEQARAFAASAFTVAGETLKRPPAGAIHILAAAGNKFVLGFSKAELAELGMVEGSEAPNGNIVKYMRDVWQWIAICRASEEQLCVWFDGVEDFKKSVAKLAMSSRMDMAEMVQMFFQVVTILNEINGARVEVKSTNHAKGHPKKKARNPAR